MQNVMDPREVIDFLRKDKNQNLFGVGREITYRFFHRLRHGCCVQLRQFFRRFGNGVALHYEIEEYDEGIGVEIHSELTEALPDVHAFIYEQFKDGHKLELKGRVREGNLVVERAYRFATQEIVWRGRNLGEVIEDIKVAVDELYRKYDTYLNYVEKYYLKNHSVKGCQGYNDFIKCAKTVK